MSWMDVIKLDQINIAGTGLDTRPLPEDDDEDCCEEAMKFFSQKIQERFTDWVVRQEHWVKTKRPEFYAKLMGRTPDGYFFEEMTKLLKQRLIDLPNTLKNEYSKPCFIFYSLLSNGEGYEDVPVGFKDLDQHLPTNIILGKELFGDHNIIAEKFRGLCTGTLTKWVFCDKDIDEHVRKYFFEGD